MTELFNRRYLDALAERVLVYDGAMGTSLQNLQLTAADFGGEKLWGCNDYLVISKPEAVETVHNSFLEVGCDVVETCTFRSNRLTLREYGLDDRVVEINRVAAQLARCCVAAGNTVMARRILCAAYDPERYLTWAKSSSWSGLSTIPTIPLPCPIWVVMSTAVQRHVRP